MKKRFITIVTAGVLLAAGLGSFAHAQDPVNQVHAGFATRWHYNVPSDSFENHEVLAEKSWRTDLQNWDDDSDEAVNGVILTLQSCQEFDYMNPAPNSTDPPTWSFGNVEEGSRVGVEVGSVLDLFTPGYDASRSATTVFTTVGTQTLTINVTPKAAEASVYIIHIDTGICPLAETVITSVTTTEGYNMQLNWDEGYVHIEVWDLGMPDTFTATVEIQVTPNVPEVKYMPEVSVSRILMWPLDEPPPGDTVDLTGEIGTWTWSADDIYQWFAHTECGTTICDLSWEPICKEIIEHKPMTGQKLIGSGACVEWTYPGETDVNHLDTGFFLTNPDCVSAINIERIFVFAYDGTVVYEGPLRVKVNDEWEVYDGQLIPHQTLQTALSYYDLPDITHEVEMWYTVEVFWTWTDKEGLPLTGWAASMNVVRDGDTGEATDIIMWGTTQMLNMVQELKPKY